MANRLSTKEKGFVRDIIKGETGTQAILNNYDTEDENTAGVMASQNLTKLKIQEAIKTYADRIPDTLLEEVHLQGLKAGRLVNDELEADYAVRHKYLDSAYKLKGSYAPDKNVNMNVNVTTVDPTDTAILEALKTIQNRLENEI